MAQKTVTLKLNLDAKTLKGASKSFAESAAGAKKWQTALKEVNAELDAEQKKLVKLQAGRTPEALRRKAHIENMKEKITGKEAPEVLPFGRRSERLLKEQREREAKKSGGILDSMGLGGAAKALGPALGAIGAAKMLSSVAGGFVKRIGGEIQRLVGLANPGTMKRFNMVLEDNAAILGHTLTPVVEIWTKEFKVLGDFMASILPSGHQVRDLFGGLDGAFTTMQEVLADLAPTIKLGIVTGIKMYAEFLKYVWKGIKRLVDLAKEFGLIKGGGRLVDSKGAAARSASFQDPDAAAKQFYQEIFSQQGRDPNRETADNTHSILEEFAKLPERIGKAVADALGTRGLGSGERGHGSVEDFRLNAIDRLGAPARMAENTRRWLNGG